MQLTDLLQNFNQDDEDDDDAFDFDPADLRTKRQAALANAMMQPIFSNEKAKQSRQNEVVYPFVFDSFAKAKMAPGLFIISYTGT